MKKYMRCLWVCGLFMPLGAQAQDKNDNTQSETLQNTAEVTSNHATDEETGNTEPDVAATIEPRPDHVRKVAPWPEDKEINATLHTSLGDIKCELFAGTHPLTVLNFKALSHGLPAWTDASGQSHQTPYYQELPFGTRVKNRYVTSSHRPEGTGFVVVDERCQSHQPVAGSIAMVQNFPGQAAAQFMLLASDIPVFKGMYAVFGQCAPIDIIQKLTETDAVLHSVSVEP